MPITKLASEVTDEDRPFVCSRGHADGTVTLYYEGDEIPELEVIPTKPVITVTPRQFRQALTRAGLRADVEAAVLQADQDTKDWYEFSSTFESTHPVVLAVADAIGKDEEDVDALFEVAQGL